jgi:hypothetical protein
MSFSLSLGLSLTRRGGGGGASGFDYTQGGALQPVRRHSGEGISTTGTTQTLAELLGSGAPPFLQTDSNKHLITGENNGVKWIQGAKTGTPSTEKYMTTASAFEAADTDMLVLITSSGNTDHFMGSIDSNNRWGIRLGKLRSTNFLNGFATGAEDNTHSTGEWFILHARWIGNGTSFIKSYGYGFDGLSATWGHLETLTFSTNSASQPAPVIMGSYESSLVGSPAKAVEALVYSHSTRTPAVSEYDPIIAYLKAQQDQLEGR